MAENAAKEPTMEEILASIRQIISEDGDTVEAANETEATGVDDLEVSLDASSEDAFDVSELLDNQEEATREAVNENDDFLSVDELLGDGETDFSDLDNLNALEAGQNAGEMIGGTVVDEVLSEDISAEPQVELEVTDGDETQSIEDILGEIKSVEAAAEEANVEPTPVAQTPTPVMEAPMAQPVSAAPSAAAPNAAASALGVAGAGNALEGLVSELMKPVIKEWIDNNLPALVERRVEAEINQIAAKVISALRDA